ncbi:MAG: hypothetical protein HUJ29_05255 [Gammaproteobacteria bacterium]|nr:hypothetical protein [Gammaproteobacteria bacterium]
MTVNQIYIRLLLLGALFGPLLWFLFSDEGQRISDTFLLKLGGTPEVQLDYRTLNADISEKEFVKGMGEAEFQCGDQQSQFGDRLCYAALAAVNGTPSQYMSVFFKSDNLTAIKLAYQRSYHEQLHGSLIRNLGEPMSGANTAVPDAERIQQWQAGNGVVLLSGETLAEDEEPVLLWLAYSN